MDLTQFEPDRRRAEALDARMHRELAASLAHLAEATAQSDAGLAAGIEADANRLQAAVETGHRTPPLTFCAYFQLTEALTEGDRAGAEAALATIADSRPRAPQRQIRWVGNARDAALSDAVADRNAGSPFALAPVTEADAQAFSALLTEGFDLLEAVYPALYGEIDALNHEVLLGHSATPKLFDFDGASHYQLWGLVMLNPTHHTTPIQVVEVLAHEISHGLLFGMTVEEPLVFNPDDALYPSPLRKDLRPMDGIFHAAYVSARMAMAMERLAVSPCLNASDRAAAAKAAAEDRANFAAGDVVIRAHARLSETGAAAIESARTWMAGNAPIPVEVSA